MEPYACKTVLLSLVSYGLSIVTFTTDRSSSIRTMLQSCPEFSHIVHEFDPWHWISTRFINLTHMHDCDDDKPSKLILSIIWDIVPKYKGSWILVTIFPYSVLDMVGGNISQSYATF
jgi:hypothetical protein